MKILRAVRASAYTIALGPFAFVIVGTTLGLWAVVVMWRFLYRGGDDPMFAMLARALARAAERLPG